jgi:hypothetical protein
MRFNVKIALSPLFCWLKSVVHVRKKPYLCGLNHHQIQLFFSYVVQLVEQHIYLAKIQIQMVFYKSSVIWFR